MISIILPVYNAEPYIVKCVESIRTQTYKDWELIVIDNGSEDKSYSICKELAKEDPRIEVFHQYKNKGVSQARNLGLERVSGEFLTFIDADDWIAPDYLEVLFKEQQKEDADMVVCGYRMVTEEDRRAEETIRDSKSNREEVAGKNKTFHQEKTEYTRDLYSLKEYVKNYLLEGNTHCWGVLYRTRKIREVSFPGKITIGEDLLYLIQAAKQMDKILVLGYQGYRYFINPRGAMLKKFTPEYMDQLVCWQLAKEELLKEDSGLEDKLNSILVVSALLVVGKMAELSEEERGSFHKEPEECQKIVNEYGKKKEVRRYLPKGYPLKVLVFTMAPGLYLKLYGARKQQTRNGADRK